MHKVLRASINICGSNIEEKSHNKAFRKEKKKKRREENSDKTETSNKKKRREIIFCFRFQKQNL